MAEKIKIRKHTEGDSRVAKEIPTFNAFENANIAHRLDVKVLMEFCAEELKIYGSWHDWTKTSEPFAHMLYHDLCGTIEGRMKFTDGEWAKMHYEGERHHLNEHCPDDVNMFDVIAMICDCVAAGMARSGEVYDVDIPSDVLKRAVSNTVEYLKGYVEVTE